ncbi:lysophosphatidic acid acyltransferase LOA1 [Aspergillus undulatus]|uniref:lysophosphatidic acid acyltransferase LOA1 n=1 Tax=Aspergillus undulatus TaxID=1810928 RepID=UPI003CCCC6BF
MEKFSQFRDRGSGIAPFLPVPLQPAPGCCPLPIRALLFFFRVPFFVFIIASYFLILQWLPLGSLGKKAALWCILGIPSIWWVDLQVDGVRKGNLSRQQSRLPGPGSVIAASFTSPIDALYLAAIFDPIFTASYPTTREVEHISLLSAILRAFAQPQLHPARGAKMVSLEALGRKYPNRSIVSFSECTTTNGRAILPLSPSLVSVRATTKVFPVSLRYSPEDIVTPVPGCYLSFLWALLSKPTHYIRVRIAEPVTVEDCAGAGSQRQAPLNVADKMKDSTFGTNYFDDLNEIRASKTKSRAGMAGAAPHEVDGEGEGEGEEGGEVDLNVTPAEKNLLDAIGESLARLGRVKRVGLGVSSKVAFVQAWRGSKRTW